ncbi:MAG: hypothetical protein KDD44_09675 [Bdellovibrionales bacterium]|nr:hypothetical protein [Bdellovibrionales bacterium]
MSEIREIFERITERFEVPVRVGSRCEANVFYRVDALEEEEVQQLARYVAERIDKVCNPAAPEILVNLPGGFTSLAAFLSEELAAGGEKLPVINYNELNPYNGHSSMLKNANVVLVNDVITTARSCLEAHTKVTMMGASVLCWGALIDRTFGPGPVPVVACITGEPVRLLE